MEQNTRKINIGLNVKLLCSQLSMFLNNTNYRNMWLVSPELSTDEDVEYLYNTKIYVRKAMRTYLNEGVKCLDIAAIDISKDYQSKELFTRFLIFAEKQGLPIYIENVQKERFQNFFLDRGYIVTTKEPITGTLCLYKPIATNWE